MLLCDVYCSPCKGGSGPVQDAGDYTTDAPSRGSCREPCIIICSPFVYVDRLSHVKWIYFSIGSNLNLHLNIL